MLFHGFSLLGSAARKLASIFFDGSLGPVGSVLYGPEIVNGLFNVDWGTSGASGTVEDHADGSYTITVLTTGTGNTNPRLDFSVFSNREAGESYKYAFDYEVLSGVCIVTGIYNGAAITGTEALSGISSYDFTTQMIATRTSQNLYFDGRNTFSVKISNVSVKHANTGRLIDKGKAPKDNAAVYSGGATLFNGADQEIVDIDPITLSGQQATFIYEIVPTASLNQYHLYFDASPIFWQASAEHRVYIAGVNHIIGTMTAGEKYDIVAIVDNGLLTVLWNGEIVYEAACGDIDTFISAPRIASNNGSAFTNGEMNGVAVIDGALSVMEAQASYAYREEFFAHCNPNDSFTSSRFSSFGSSDVKLLMPLNRKGEAQVDYAQGFGSELVTGGFIVGNQGNWTENGDGSWTCDGLQSASTSIYSASTLADDEYYLCGVVADVQSGDCGIYVGGDTENLTISSSGTYYFIAQENGPNRWYAQAKVGFEGTVTPLSLKQISAYEISNHTTSCDVVKQQHGVQMIQFDHDESTGLLGAYEPKLMHFDSGVYVDALEELGITGEDIGAQFAVEVIFKRPPRAADDVIFKSYESGAGVVFRSCRSFSNSRCDVYIYGEGASNYKSTTVIEEYTHMIAMHDGTYLRMINNGAEIGSPLEAPYTPSTNPVNIFRTDSAVKGLFTHTKVWYGNEFAKFDPAKAWAKAQAVIMELESGDFELRGEN